MTDRPEETTQDLRTHVGGGLYVRPLGHTTPEERITAPSGGDDVRSQGATGPVTGTSVEGRWTIEKLPGSLPVGIIRGPATSATGEPVPVVPVDDAAVERAARAIDEAAMGALDGIRNEDPDRIIEWARAALRAAGASS